MRGGIAYIARTNYEGTSRARCTTRGLLEVIILYYDRFKITANFDCAVADSDTIVLFVSIRRGVKNHYKLPLG
ncbi:hypothetical protein M199_gp055 [Halogranum tailed virus 1]|uniref:Uncharacterized protein n=1 Tax=Halogranum tailed virus 1 TaxID=1273749 RepID=R4TH45_9CAUD|nr:hypothetical protein M199_gp055 [Halogranum tailed virus 1]AGM11611.1 hypothetical protein HGTV1_314 [Halogranum tailed virus 1]